MDSLRLLKTPNGNIVVEESVYFKNLTNKYITDKLPDLKDDIESRTHYPTGVTFDDIDHRIYIPKGFAENAELIVLVENPVNKIVNSSNELGITIERVINMTRQTSRLIEDLVDKGVKSIKFVSAYDQDTITDLTELDSIPPVTPTNDISSEDLNAINSKFEKDVELFDRVSTESFIETYEGVEIPEVITARQLKLQLHLEGELEFVELVIGQADEITKIEWATSTEFRRDWHSLQMMVETLSEVSDHWSDEYVNHLFIKASNL